MCLNHLRQITCRAGLKAEDQQRHTGTPTSLPVSPVVSQQRQGQEKGEPHATARHALSSEVTTTTSPQEQLDTICWSKGYLGGGLQGLLPGGQLDVEVLPDAG
jgi:hypothetical protein